MMKSLKRKIHVKFFIPQPDFIYNSELVSKLINYIMKGGNLTIAKKIVYSFLEKIIILIQNSKTKKNILSAEKETTLGHQVLENIIDILQLPYEIRKKKMGGCSYQIPCKVKDERVKFMPLKILVKNARILSRKNKKNIVEALIDEGMSIINQSTCASIKFVNDTRKTVLANKALERLHKTRKIKRKNR